VAEIFISYNRRSAEIVATLASDIEALGHVAWYDQEDLSGGQVWWEQILARIRTCDVFVFALSPAALKSTACGREQQYAVDLGKSILPVLVADGISPNLLPTTLSRIQFVDYRAPDRKVGLRLARALSHLPPSKPLPDPLPPPPDTPLSYLASVAEQVDAAGALSRKQQSALLTELKRSLREPENAEDGWTLIGRLRKRRDLFATIADEINELIASSEQRSGGGASRASSPASPSPAPQQRPAGPTTPTERESVAEAEPSAGPGVAHSSAPTHRERWRTALFGLALGPALGISLLMFHANEQSIPIDMSAVLLAPLYPGALFAAAGAFAGSWRRWPTLLAFAVGGWFAIAATDAAQPYGFVLGGFVGAPFGALVGGIALEMRRRSRRQRSAPGP